MSKVYCRYCGNKIDEDASFCTYCGKEQSVVNSEKLIKSSGQNSSLQNFFITALNWFRKRCRNLVAQLKNIIPRFTDDQKQLHKKRLRRFGWISLSVLVLALLIAGGIWGYNYYNEDYLPQKMLDEACDDVINKFSSEEDSIVIEYSKKILQNETYWGYDGVSNYDITDRMSSLREIALQNIETIAEKGNSRVQFLLGNIYYGYTSRTGEQIFAINPNKFKAVYWWNEAAKREYVVAYNNMGLAYENGEGVDKDIRKAVEYFKLGAEKGEPYAQANYGRLFRDGVRIKVGSHKEEYTTMEYQFDNEYKRSYYTSDWRKVYVKERTVDDYKWLVPKDIEKAKYWWTKSAEQGNEYAKEMLQKVYE